MHGPGERRGAGRGWAGLGGAGLGWDTQSDGGCRRAETTRAETRHDAHARAYTHNNNLGGDGRRGFGTRGAPAHAQTNTAGRTGDIIILYALYNAN